MDTTAIWIASLVHQQNQNIYGFRRLRNLLAYGVLAIYLARLYALAFGHALNDPPIDSTPAALQSLTSTGILYWTARGGHRQNQLSAPKRIAVGARCPIGAPLTRWLHQSMWLLEGLQKRPGRPTGVQRWSRRANSTSTIVSTRFQEPRSYTVVPAQLPTIIGVITRRDLTLEVARKLWQRSRTWLSTAWET